MEVGAHHTLDGTYIGGLSYRSQPLTLPSTARSTSSQLHTHEHGLMSLSRLEKQSP
jgi:hypothetical protein